MNRIEKLAEAQTLAQRFAVGKFQEALGAYWDAAYEEGLRQATHDDEQATAQRAHQAVSALYANALNELDRVTRWLAESDAEWSHKLNASDREAIEVCRELNRVELEKKAITSRATLLEDRIRQALAVLNEDEALEAQLLLKAVLSPG